MTDIRPDESILDGIVTREPRYARNAYDFTRSAVSYASGVYFATGTHVTGRELCEAIRSFASDRFGLLTADVFATWGIRSTEDFGEIVFLLVEAGLLSKTEDDSKADFAGGWSAAEVIDPQEYWRDVLEAVG